MANSEDIINWPFVDATSPTKDTDAAKAVQSNTPYQPHNNYTQDTQEYAIRKRLTTSLLSLGISLFSDVVSITLYILVGLQQHEYAWLFRTWVVVSAGLTGSFGILAASFWVNYRRVRKFQGSDQGETGMSLKALGRKGLFESFSWAGEFVDADDGEEVETQRQSSSAAREPLVKNGNELFIFNMCASTDFVIEHKQSSPITVLHRPDAETSHSNSSQAISNTLNALTGRKIVPNHILRPTDHQIGRTCGCASCTPPPRFPSPAKLSERAKHRDMSEDDPFYSSTPVARRDSLISPLTEGEVVKVRRSESMKKVREATLRRKQAFEVLK